MTLDDIAKKYAETTDAICMCGVKKYHESVLVLLYSAIDALSWLYSDQMDVNKRNVGDDYKKWVITFLLPNLEGYNCTATEIYLARCSVLHTERNTELFNKVIKKASNYYTDTTQIVNLIIEKKGNFNE